MAQVSVVKPRTSSRMHQLVDDYLMACRARGLAPATINNSYGFPLLSIFLPWCDENGIAGPEQLTSRTIDAFSVALQQRRGRSGEPISKFSVHAYARGVRGFLNWCTREGEQVAARPPLPRLPRRVLDVLDRQEIAQLEAAAPTERDRIIIRILGDCGLRAEELCSLRVDDVVRHDRQAYLHVFGKRGLERLVPVSPSLLRRIERYIRDVRRADDRQQRLFTSLRRGRSGDYEPLTRSGILQLIRHATERAEITKRVHTHLLRHSFITNALRAGMNPMIVARIAGHTSLRMLDQVYSHLNTNDTYEAMLRMLTDESPRR